MSRRLTADTLLELPTGQFRLSDDPLPRHWRPLDPAIRHAADIQISRGKLRLKVVVFDKPSQLQRFWRRYLGRPVGKNCLGVVTRLYHEREEFMHPGRMVRSVRVDPRYYAVMGLCKDHLSTEIIVHESLHAAMAFVARTHRYGRLWSGDGDLGEEEIAYPLGRIVSELNNWLHGEGLL